MPSFRKDKYIVPTAPLHGTCTYGAHNGPAGRAILAYPAQSSHNIPKGGHEVGVSWPVLLRKAPLLDPNKPLRDDTARRGR